ncbi:hypothetical protein OF829_04150 [Sphingomonas sp. LB-2]|uniref:hypothetical protein n=1 Tax=Sphingomonas caeni TaxID=2984949 RepID=UPI00222FC1BB|nr:hypothetical protein [Sphingomonas caeni]MCW3846419.1 hypothetical protein [Sphingomonas caeni]
MRALPTLVLAVLASACAPDAPRPAPAEREALQASWRYDPQLMPDNLALTLENRGNAPACVPQVDIDEGLQLSQNGAVVFRNDQSNRLVLRWKDADLAGGMAVIPPGRSITVFSLLPKWPLRPGAVAATLRIPVYDCESYFRLPKPTPRRLESRFTFRQ